jgi:hypothetical protein
VLALVLEWSVLSPLGSPDVLDRLLSYRSGTYNAAMYKGYQDIEIPETPDEIAMLASLIAEYALIDIDLVRYLANGVFVANRGGTMGFMHYRVLLGHVHEIEPREASRKVQEQQPRIQG